MEVHWPHTQRGDQLIMRITWMMMLMVIMMMIMMMMMMMMIMTIVIMMMMIMMIVFNEDGFNDGDGDNDDGDYDDDAGDGDNDGDDDDDTFNEDGFNDDDDDDNEDEALLKLFSLLKSCQYIFYQLFSQLYLHIFHIFASFIILKRILSCFRNYPNVSRKKERLKEEKCRKIHGNVLKETQFRFPFYNIIQLYIFLVFFKDFCSLPILLICEMKSSTYSVLRRFALYFDFLSCLFAVTRARGHGREGL